MEDYADAAQRHFDDAKLLHTQVPSRLANASHLYGFSAECALKSIMLGRKQAGKALKIHLPSLFDEFQNHSIAKNNVDLVQRVKKCAIGLSNWKVEQRYYKQTDETVFNVQTVNDEAEAARKFLKLRKQYMRGII